jgi:DNA modification methylase
MTKIKKDPRDPDKWKNRIISYGEVDPQVLNPNPDNWRRHPKAQKEALQSVLKRIGWLQDVIINKRTDRLIDGHLWVKIAIEGGEDKVPVKYVDLSEEEEKEALLTFDPITGMAEADKELLERLMQRVKFDDEKIQEMMNRLARENHLLTHSLKEDDYQPPETVRTSIKRGTLIALGAHRILCGDAREDLPALIRTDKPDLLFTDPPYGISVVKKDKKARYHKSEPHKTGKVGGGGTTKFTGRIGDDNYVSSKTYPVVEGDESTDTCKEVYSLLQDLPQKIIFGGNYFTDFLPPSRCWIVWDKENTGSFAQGELAWTSFDKVVKIYRWLWNGLSRKGSRAEEGPSRYHPTQKPVGLFGKILLDFSRQGDVILDPFLGAGTTLIASEQTGRICLGMELSPEYCEICCQRWESLTGRKRELIDMIDAKKASKKAEEGEKGLREVAVHSNPPRSRITEGDIKKLKKAAGKEELPPGVKILKGNIKPEDVLPDNARPPVRPPESQKKPGKNTKRKPEKPGFKRKSSGAGEKKGASNPCIEEETGVGL